VTATSRLVDLMARMLEPDERDAVCGDLAESRETGARQLREVAGLVARRHAALWFDWRPWLALAGLALPLGLMLSLFARSVEAESATYAWMFANWWSPSFLTVPGARLELTSNIGRHLLTYMTLVSWAWTCGFVLSSLSRRTAWLNGSLFCLVLFGDFLSIREFHPGNNVLFSTTFFRVIFPALLRTLLIAVPALLGMQTGLRRATLPLWQTLLWGLVIAGVTIRAADSLQSTMTMAIMNEFHVAAGPYTMEQGRLMLQWDTWLRAMWPLRLLPLIVVWPAAYMLVTSGWRSFHSGEWS
jgi:hypothetical protein